MSITFLVNSHIFFFGIQRDINKWEVTMLCGHSLMWFWFSISATHMRQTRMSLWWRSMGLPVFRAVLYLLLSSWIEWVCACICYGRGHACRKHAAVYRDIQCTDCMGGRVVWCVYVTVVADSVGLLAANRCWVALLGAHTERLKFGYNWLQMEGRR